LPVPLDDDGAVFSFKDDDACVLQPPGLSVLDDFVDARSELYGEVFRDDPRMPGTENPVDIDV